MAYFFLALALAGGHAKGFLPWVTSCEVKRGLDFDKALLLGPEKAHARIREKAIEAIENLKACQVYEQAKPVTVICTAP